MLGNRRRYTRVRARDVVAELLTPHGRSPVHLENISRGGAFVRAERTLDVGSDVTVTLARAGARKTLLLSARVTSRVDAQDGRASRRLPGMGMQFMSVGAQESVRLHALLRDLGALDDDAELTLPPEATEAELRALDIETVPAARKPSRGGVKFELPRHLADDVANVLQDVERAPRRKAPPPPPPDAIAEAQARPAGDVQPRRTSSDPRPPEVKRLMLQVRGLMMQLAEAQQQIARRDLDLEALREELDGAAEVAAAEIARLRTELSSARAALERKLQKG